MAVKHLFYMFVPMLFILTSCGQDEAQIQFEREAFSMPSGFTPTSGTGVVDEENADPDDWRVSPFFSGLIYSIDPVYPNPVLTNDRLTLQISLAGINDIQRIQVYVFDSRIQSLKPVSDYAGPIPSVIILTIEARLIPYNLQDPEGLYRLIVTDERDNVITYGDVQVQ